FLLWGALAARERQSAARAVQAVTDRLAQTLSDDMEDRVQALERMASRLKVGPPLTRAAWEIDAANYVRDTPGFQGVGWADAGERARWVVPFAENKAIVGVSLGFEERRRAALDDALRRGAAVGTRPLTLLQGGRGF